MDREQSTLDSGQADSGQWTVDSGQWTGYCILRKMDSGQSTWKVDMNMDMVMDLNKKHGDVSTDTTIVPTMIRCTQIALPIRM